MRSPRIQEHACHVFHEQDAHLDRRPVHPGGEGDSARRSCSRGGWRFTTRTEPYKVVQLGRVDEDGPSAVVTAGQFGVPIKNLVCRGANVWDWDTDTIKTR
jgi:hypothetical protein